MTARISIWDEPSISLPPREEIPSSPLPIPSTPPNSPTHIEIPESCLPLRKRVHFASPTPSHEVGESSAAGAARRGFKDGPAVAREDPYSVARGDLYGFVDMDHKSRSSWTKAYRVVEMTTDLRMAKFQRRLDPQKRSGTGVRRPVQVARECTYPDFLKCQPLNFKGTEGVVGLTQWFEKMESVYSISNCTVACQVKFATCTLQGNALTWWNSHVKTTTPEAAHAMPWRTLKKMMTDKYCPRGEIKKLEFEMWNLKVKGNDVVTYSQRFQELALMCDRMFPEEIDQVEKYVGGLPDTIHGSVMATKPKTMQDAIEFATELMDKKINTWVEQNGDRRPYGGPRPLCPKCNYHHDGPCAPKCHKCNRFGHVSRDCRSPPNVNTGANQRACFECGAQGKGVCRRQCKGKPGQQCHHGSRIVITPTALDHDYNVEIADGRIVGLNTIIRGCTLNLLNHPFNIDLMPVELGSFDVIIGMDWLAKYHAVIICAEKIVCIPFRDQILIVHGDGSRNKHWTRLNIISCTKAQEYLMKGCHVFLANITATKDEDKSKEKRLKDVPVVQEFPKVFPEDLSGIPPTRQVEF
ncbi:putative reverse transcriptase domain-containing protein [Tanacetum coccineum]